MINKSFLVTWRKCIRRLWKIPHNTHCNLVHLLYPGLRIDAVLLLRFAKFYYKVLESNNIYVSLCGKLCVMSDTAVAKNRRHFLKIVNDNGIIFSSSMSNIISRIKYIFRNNDEVDATANVVKELCYVREGFLNVGLTHEEVVLLIHDVCTD